MDDQQQRPASVFNEYPTDQGVKALKLAQTALTFIALQTEVFLRQQFGERYLSFLQLYLSWGFLASWVFFVAPLLFHGFGPLMVLYSIAFIGLSIYHRAVIWHRTNILRRPWHTRMFGISRLTPLAARAQMALAARFPQVAPFIELDRWALIRFGEPTLCLLTALLIGKLDHALGIWLALSAAGLFIKGNLAYYEEYNRLCDIMDAQLYNQYLWAAMAGKPEEETAGVVAVAPSRALRETLVASEEHMAARAAEVVQGFQAAD